MNLSLSSNWQSAIGNRQSEGSWVEQVMSKPSVHLQRLIEELAQMHQQRRVVDHEGGSSAPGRLVSLGALRGGKGDHRNVAGGRVLPQGRDGFASLFITWLQIDK